MAVPKRRQSRSRTRKRRSHDAMKPLYLSRCKQCGSASMPHRICDNCGHYGGRTVIDKEII